jgi:hypothetical protein
MGARDLDPILSIEYTTDPMWYKFPSLSPYNAMGNNPIMFIDPDGKKVVDAVGNTITYSHQTGWSANATPDVIRVGNAMMVTPTGAAQFNKMVDAEYPITLTVSPAIKIRTTSDGQKVYTLGQSKKTFSNNSKTNVVTKIHKIDVVIYEGTINELIKNGNSEKADAYRNNTTNNDERIAAVAGHETVHTTDLENIQKASDNIKLGTNYNVEELPNQIEMQILQETKEKTQK